MPSWKDEAIEDFRVRGKSYQEIADKYGRSRHSIIRLMKINNVQRTTPVARKGGRPKSEDIPPLSDIHKQIGLQMNVHRTVTLGLNLTDFGAQLGKSCVVTKAMELGQYDFTLMDLWKIGEMLGQDLTELMTLRQLVVPSG